jgi:hypothetical protein
VSRNVPGAFGRLRPHRWLPRVIALGLAIIVVSACGPAPGEAKFSLSIRNSGDVPVRLKIIVASQGTPGRDLLVPERSGILQTAEQVMDVKDGKAEPVTIEVYTDTCALVATVTAGEGRTRVNIGPEFAVTTAGGAPDSSGAVEPDSVPACSPSS